MNSGTALTSRSPLARIGRPLQRLRRRILLHRRPLAALCAAAAAFVGVQAATAPPPPTVAVWTAARDLPSGTVLGDGDLAQVEFAPGSVPAAVIDSPRALLGRTVAAPLTKGEPVTANRVVAPGMLAGYPGLSAVPIRLTDPGVVPLLTAGDRVTVLATDPQTHGGARVLVADAPVLAIPRSDRSAPTNGLPGRLVVFGVPPEDVPAVTSAAATAFVTVTWNR